MKVSDLPSIRQHNQGLSTKPFKDAIEVVRHLGAVQAQDYLGALWSIGMRIPGATELDIEKAVEAGSILRTWPMRGTIHFVPAEDAAWMVKLMAGRINQKMASYYRKVDLTDKVFGQAREVLTEVLAAGPLPRLEIYKILESKKIATHKMRGMFIMANLAQEGTLCFGPRMGKQPSFALLDKWVAKTVKTPNNFEGDEAVAELMLRYFASHGPAQLNDFIWWTGLKVSEVKAGLELVSDKLETEEIEGKTYYSLPSKTSKVQHAPKAYLLQAYDEYTVAYKDRTAITHPDNQDKDWRMLPFYSAVIIDGVASGFWKRTLKKDKVLFEYDWLRKLSKAEQGAVVEAEAEYARFLDIPT